MEFNVKRDVFLGGVQRTLGIVDRRTSMPVLNNVLIRAEADRIRDELSAMGISLKDAKNPVTGEIETAWEIAR